MAEPIVEKIGDGIELMIEGIPKSVLTPAIQAKAALALVQHSIPLGVHISAGIIGEIGDATLKIGNKLYKIKFAYRAMRVITALEIYGEAKQWIEYKSSIGSFDSQMADDAIKYLREDFQRHLKKWE
jgi:hypothetical protein